MDNFQYAEKVRRNIERIAKENGDTVLHSWVFDLQDGTCNVKAIIKTHEGNHGTIGWHIG